MGDHYFTSEPASPDQRRTLEVMLAGQRRVVEVAPGIFSPGGIDRGTSVLLDHVPPPPSSGQFVDLGCGWGPIALTMGLLAPDAEVWAVDVNHRSLDLCARNATSLGLHRITPGEPADFPVDRQIDLLWSNPPIRIGKAALHEMLAGWLARLAPGGAAYLVAAKDLGADSLLRWLADTMSERAEVSRIATSKGFRVIEVVASS